MYTKGGKRALIIHMFDPSQHEGYLYLQPGQPRASLRVEVFLTIQIIDNT